MADGDATPTASQFYVVRMRGFLVTSFIILFVLSLPLLVFVLGKATDSGVFACAQYRSFSDSQGTTTVPLAPAAQPAAAAAGTPSPAAASGENTAVEEPSAEPLATDTQTLRASSTGMPDPDGPRTVVTGEEHTSCYRTYIGINWLAIISATMLFGALGVMISLILRREIDVRLSGLKVVALLTVVYLIGSIFAIILLCVFIGGFLQGTLFPNFLFLGDSWVSLDARPSTWGQLAVWSFLAGFSERLMPSLLDRILERIDRPSAVRAGVPERSDIAEDAH